LESIKHGEVLLRQKPTPPLTVLRQRSEGRHSTTAGEDVAKNRFAVFRMRVVE
jgi:hypothetical protein